ncbi:hypothetical protein ACGF1Z_27755 [Streptomyces sp. NPDC048018]|uniref:hypothetical protein n=1 Tax=Streptomyces sp. NPDC048018 TaxID=3365499 RepID=UPI003715DAD1
MSTEPQRPASRITEALLPQERPAPPATPLATAPPAPRAAERPVSRITEALLPAERPAATPPVPPAATPPERPAAPPAVRPGAQPLPPEQPSPGAEAPVETTTRLRPVRDDRPSPPAGQVRAGRPAPAAGPAPAYRPAADPRPAPPAGAHVTPGHVHDAWALSAETPFETTTRLRPVRERGTARLAGAVACAVLALGLVGGALTGAVLAGSGAGEPAEPAGYTQARALWHNAPVDTLFPRTLTGASAGPGGSARTWTRIVVAPDAPCTATTLPKALNTTLATIGCDRVLRATYTDATSSHVVTVALVFTQADPATMRTLGSRAADEAPPALAAPGTVAAGFGPPQRASWWRHVLTDLPVVVTAVSGFADGRAVAEPEPAERAMTPKRTTAVAQAGLGHEAKGVADAVERTLRRTVAGTVEEDQR